MEGFLRTYYIKTFGCQMNYADSEKVNMALLQSGLKKVLDPAEASIVILNTCSVRQKGEDRVFGYVREIRTLSERLHRPILIGITGCMVRKTGIAKRYLPTELERASPKGKISLSNEHSFLNWDDDLLFRSDRIDFVFRIEEVGCLSKILTILTRQEFGNDEKWEEYLKMRQARENPLEANVIIQTGCDNFCTFCIVPYTRGREISRPMEDIVQEVERVVREGAKEITLLWQNVNSYGKETRSKLWDSESLTWKVWNGTITTPFRELLGAIGSISGLHRIRFTSSNPHDMTKDVLDAHFEIPSMMPYLHLALQSGSDRILKQMNRKHTFSDFRAQVEYLRSKDPLFAISTDLIVGFPGETEEDFLQTLSAIEMCEFDFAFIARYSPRKGTVATDIIGDDIPASVKAERWNRANAALEKSVRKRATKMVGRMDEILITGIGKDGWYVGRTRYFKEAFIPDANGVKIGDIVPIRILEVDRWVLRGEIL